MMSHACKANRLYRRIFRKPDLSQDDAVRFLREVLTLGRREFFDLYYNEDLSLAEIAENYGISRQGVRDVIVRAEAAMTELEDKTGSSGAYADAEEGAGALRTPPREIRTINYRQYENPELERLTAQICEYAAALRSKTYGGI